MNIEYKIINHYIPCLHVPAFQYLVLLRFYSIFFFLQNGTTALMLATGSKKSETVKLLLSHKADVYQMNKVCKGRVIIQYCSYRHANSLSLK